MKKKIFFLIFAYILIFSLFELTARSIVYVASKEKIIFSYGFNKKISFQIRDLSELNFEIINYEILRNNNIKKSKNTSSKTKIWTFGGSTSDIACINQNNTSWPIEIENVNDNYKVKNFAKSGTNSDFALNSLLSNLYSNKNEKPDFILWANYVNETDVLTFGFENNRDLEKNIQIEKAKNIFFYYLKSISVSLDNYSIFYSLFKRALLALAPRLGLNTEYDRENFTEEQIKMAAQNYFINTSEAIKLSQKFNIKFYIILLFDKSDLKLTVKDPENKLKDVIFSKMIKNLRSNFKEIYFINLKNFQNLEVINKENIFCDGVHFTSYGNNIVANIIIDRLDNEN